MPGNPLDRRSDLGTSGMMLQAGDGQFAGALDSQLPGLDGGYILRSLRERNPGSMGSRTLWARRYSPPSTSGPGAAVTNPTDPDGLFNQEAIPQMDAVYRFALRLAGSPAEAEDLVQETYLRAWRAWAQYTPGTSCKSWLFTICRNVHLRRSERSQRHEEIVRQETPNDARSISAQVDVFQGYQHSDPEGDFFASLVDEDVLRAVDDLPGEFREAVVLSDVEGLPYQEVANVLQIPVGTVKSRIFRGRKLLQKALYDYALEMGYISKPAAQG